MKSQSDGTVVNFHKRAYFEVFRASTMLETPMLMYSFWIAGSILSMLSFSIAKNF